MLWTVGAAVFGLMLVEVRRAARNEDAQRLRGGVEAAGDVYKMMRVAYPGAFLVMLIEGAIGGAPGARTLAAGAALFAGAKALKWWAIVTLGDYWTFRVIVVPGMTLVVTGPYRWLRHPNYLGVVGELVGVALMTGAAVTGPPAIVLFSGLLARRLVVESRALTAAR
jgi:methyltransferase